MTKAKKGPKKRPKVSPETTAGLIAEGIGSNTLAVQTWSQEIFGPIDLTALQGAMDQSVNAVNRGNGRTLKPCSCHRPLPSMPLFANLALRAARAQLVELFERNLRLALKAQGQCRATLETLAVLKNPPVFARQANIANGPQQVNNGGIVTNGPARARMLEGAPHKSLESYGERGGRSHGGGCKRRRFADGARGRSPRGRGRRKGKARSAANAYRGAERPKDRAMALTLTTWLTRLRNQLPVVYRG